MSKRKLILIIVGVVILLCIVVGLVGCSSSSDETQSIEAQNDRSSWVTPVGLVLSERCIPAGEKQIEVINVGLKKKDDNNYVTTGYAIKSEDFESTWMVGAMIYGVDELMVDGTGPGVWAIEGEMEEPGRVVSVNSFADHFSSYRSGALTLVEVLMTNDGAEEVLDCAFYTHQW